MQISKKELRIQKWKTKTEKKRTSLRRNYKSLKGQTLLNNRIRTKRERLPSMEKNEKRHVKRKSKVKGPSYEIINEGIKDVKVPQKKRQRKEKKEKETSFEITDEEKPGCSYQLGKFVVFD